MNYKECDTLDFSCHFENGVTGVQEFFLFILQTIFEALLYVLALIPVPGWVISAASFPVPDGVLWFASALQLQSGAAIMVSAWGIRFIIRRLPFIG